MRGMRVRKLLRRRVVMRDFADRARFRRRNLICAEMGSKPCYKWCRMWEFESGSNTVPIEKGTETTSCRILRYVAVRMKQHRPHREGD